MNSCFIFISVLALGSCRPQDAVQNSGVEIEKLSLYELPSAPSKTRNISSEEEMRREASTQDILQKIAEVNLNHGLTPKRINKRPILYSSHTPHDLKNGFEKEHQPKQLPIFQFSQSPYVNPIFEYLNQNQQNQEIPNNYNNFGYKTGIETNNNKDVNDEEIPEGYVIKRKVTHQQTVFVPTYPESYFNPIQNDPSQFGGQYGLVPVNTDNNNNKSEEDLRNQAKQSYLVNNIKNIVSNSQTNPYAQINPYFYNAAPYPVNYYPQSIPTENPKITNSYYANLQAQKGRQMSGPFAGIFPIVIKNPFQQVMQAFTSMIEYGPAADLCRSNHGKSDETSIRNGKSIDENNNSDLGFYVEGLKIVDTTSNKPESKENSTKKITPEDRQMNESEELLVEEDKFFQKPSRYPSKQEDMTNGPLIPGNGIFIQKLKVRKGGVAIAGPGGIATAGSGGTAIVGPNGIAYTQPNGVAIAGPGSRVIAVDPDVNLRDFVQNASRSGIIGRLGKVVAVGPIVYHNIGEN